MQTLLDRQLVIHIEANHRNANLNPLVRTRTVPRAGPRSLSKENAYGETNRSGMSGIDWVFRLASPPLQKRATRCAGLARGDHYSPSAICKRVLFMALQTL